MVKKDIKFESGARLTTPILRCRYPRLNNPDTKWKPEGEYSIVLELSTAEPEQAAFLERLDELWDVALAEAQDYDAKKAKKILGKPWKVDEEDPSLFLLRAKTRASYEKSDGTKVERRPPLFAADGQPLAADVWIKGGSTVRAQIGFAPFMTALGFGVAAYLNAVQGINLIETDTAESYGFDSAKTEGGGEGDESSWDDAYDAAGTDKAEPATE